MSLFDDLYRDLFGDEGAFTSYKLLEGFDNKTLETNRALWELSQKALASPEVSRVIQERAESDVIDALGGSDAGKVFLDALDDFLDFYGKKGVTWGLWLPYWIEDPAPVIKNLKDYMAATGYDPASELKALAGERDKAVATARDRLKGYPQQVVDEFESLLAISQVAVVLTEDHGFWLDSQSVYEMRRIIVEVGRRLVEAGVIDQPDDIFYLQMDEIRASVAELSEGDRRELIEERRGEMAHFGGIIPPLKLGMDYGPPPEGLISRTFAKFEGEHLPQESDATGPLEGNPGSPGKIRGPAKVIRSLAEAGKLQSGDILVAPTTSPPWTPLFVTAGGIVTDTGGVLSHCAVVAREYRIPAVVGTGSATSRIKDGQILEVDGDAGIVRIIVKT